MRREHVVADLSALPDTASGMASPTWWGTFAFILIEGTGFGLAIAVYLYLFSLAPKWPLEAPPPSLLPGNVLTVILIASAFPNILIGRWAKDQQLMKVRIGLVMMSVLGVVLLGIRVLEFPALSISWDSNAYGSAAWLLLGLHTTHILTDLADTVVLMALMFTKHGEKTRRYQDVRDNVMYWNFVVLAWLPLYLCIYWVPRL